MTTKNNGFYLKMGIYLATIIFAGGAFYVLTNFRLDAVEVNAAKAEDKVEDIDAKMDTIEDNVLIMQYDVRYIKNEMIEQKELSQQILLELQK